MARKYVCCCCGKQALNEDVSIHEKYTTTLKGAKAGFSQGEVICGHCAEDLDENGMFPEEAAQCYSEGGE